MVTIKPLTTVDDYKSATSNDGICVIKFGASWCNPCQRIEPVYEEIAKGNKTMIFFKVDCDVLKEAAKAEKISSIPAFVVYNNGVRVATHTGGDEERLRLFFKDSN
jgi:thioredoxin 1